MQPLTEILLINAASASLLAVVVALIGQRIKRPAVMHVLWLLVLLKLLTPPVIEIAALPRIETLFAAEVGSAPIPVELPVAMPDDVPVESTQSRLVDAPAAIWFSGSLLLLSLSVVRIIRFRRLLVDAPPVNANVREEAARIARRIGVSSCPRIRLIAGRVPPMIWWCLGRCSLLLPAGLVDSLGVAEREALIAHELAHVRRRDPWVRYVEILATVLFWWHPVVWWARRNLRVNEEHSCDALVLEALPRQSRAYARGLVKTLDFLSVREPTVPVVATGAVGTRHLEERLTMIVKGTTPRKTTPAQRFLLATVVAGTLLVFPTWIDRVAADDDVPSPREERYAAELRELEQEARILEHRLQEVQTARMELSAAMRAEQVHSKLEAIEERAAEAQASGNLDEADRLRRAAEELERQTLIEAEKRRLAVETSRVAIEVDVMRAKAAAARANGDLDRARAVEEAIQQEIREMRERQVLLELQANGDDVELKLEKLEQMKLQTVEEIQWREQALEELRHELEKVDEYD